MIAALEDLPPDYGDLRRRQVTHIHSGPDDVSRHSPGGTHDRARIGEDLPGLDGKVARADQPASGVERDHRRDVNGGADPDRMGEPLQHRYVGGR